MTVAEAHHVPFCLVVKLKLAVPLDEVVFVPVATAEPLHVELEEPPEYTVKVTFAPEMSPLESVAVTVSGTR